MKSAARRRGGWVIAIVLLALSGSVVAVHALAKSGSGTRATIAFVGDSNIGRGSGYIVQNLTFGPQWDTPNHVDNNYLLVFAVRSGRGIRTPDCHSGTTCTTHDFWKAKLRTAFTKTKPDAIVTDLGINDSPAPGAPTSLGYSNYAQKIDWFMSLVPRTVPVFWTNTPCAVEPPRYRDGCTVVDQALTGATSRWPNLTVIDWAKVCDAHREYMTDIHYSTAGYRAWTKLVTHVLDRRFPAP